MFSQLVLATGNPGKVREFTALLQPLGITVHPQSQWQLTECAETGLSFIENAILKARHAAAGTGLPALADDSGIEVDALHGRPGIYSARYAGPGANDAANNAKLLAELAQVPPEQRTARFRCAIALLRFPEDPAPLISEGRWEGMIASTPSGAGGFGYDPLFWLPEFGCTSADLPPEEKNRLSHRGQALAGLVAKLQANHPLQAD